MHNPAIVALAVRRMKRTDLVKNLAKKIEVKMQATAVPGRFGDGAAHLPDRREQRKLDQAAGLVPFAVKLHGDLVKQLQALAAEGGGNLNALVDRLVRAGLAAQATAPSAPAKAAKVAKKAAAKKAAAKKAVALTSGKTPAKSPAKPPAKKTATKAAR